MTRRYFALTVILVALALNLVFPACGSKSGNTAYSPYSNFSCIPGQQCNGINGTPMFPAPVMTSVDSYGSSAQMMIYASGYSAGYGNYSGPVTVQAIVMISPSNQYGCPPGQYMLQGQGSFQANYGGTLGAITGQMSGQSGFQVQLNGEIYGGQDPYESQQTQFFYMGSFANSCDPGDIAE
jgi:hypothetical protein